MTRTYAFTVDGGRVRLDRFLGEALREQDVSREKVKRAIRDGGCLVDGAVLNGGNVFLCRYGGASPNVTYYVS